MKLLKSLLGLALLTISTHSFAAGDDGAGNVGVLMGISVPDYSNSTARSIVGLEGTAKLGSEYGFGAYYLSSSKSESVSSQSVDFNYQLYGVRGTYHFEGEAKGAFFGAMLGISKVKQSNIESSPMHFGLLGGFDKMLGSMFSIGGEISYISVQSSNGTVSGTSTTGNLNSFNTINILVALKFWF